MNEDLEIVQELKHVSVLSLMPGDVLIIRMPHRLSDDVVDRIRCTAEKIFPDHRCVVLADGADLAVARPT